MTDSMVLGGIIELLGGGVASTHPQAAGAYFRLGTGWDLSAPQITSEQTASLLLDGEVVTGFRASNRTPTIPVTIVVPSTGNSVADRLTLAGARELLLQTTSQDAWELVWTRDGGQPLILDCMGLSTVVIHYALRVEQGLICQVDITFQAFPYGRSDTQEVIAFNSPAQNFPTPPATVTIDDHGSTVAASNYLTGDNAGFEATVGSWGNGANCSVARSTVQAHTGTASMLLTSAAAGSMNAVSASVASLTAALAAGTTPPAGWMPCQQGDSITAKAWFRAVTTGRSVNAGADFFDANGTQIGSALRGSNVSDVTTGWIQATATVTAPSGAAWCRADPQVVSTAAGAEGHYVDDPWLDRGPVASSDDGAQWSRSGTAAFGSFSAHWSRKWHDHPLYDHTLPAAVDITARTKFGFWLGLSTPSNQWPVWHRGTVSFAVVLYDATGASVSFGFKRLCHASALINSPHWQYISAHIPQMGSGFDYTTVSRYSVKAWSRWDALAVSPTGKNGQEVLQADAYLNLVQAVATSTGTPGPRGGWYFVPGIIGTARSPLAIQAAPGPSSFSSVVEFTTAGVSNWTAPAGVTHVDKVEEWAAGGGGAGANGFVGGGGGGGGEYAMELNVPVTPLTVYHPTQGAGGAAGAGGGNLGLTGGDSFFAGDSGRAVYAHGGKGGWQTPNNWGGGKGGTGSSNYGHYDGGDGFQANAETRDIGGGGASSGGASRPGFDATGRTGAANPFDGGPGGDGGFSGPDTIPLSRGFLPVKGPGGGGGGGSSDGSGYAGAAGDPGKSRLTFGASGLLPLQSLMVHSAPRDAPDTFNPLTPVGNGADTPNGATEYLVPDIGNLNARFDGTYTLYLIASSFNTPSSSRNLTVQLRQYPYTGGTALTLNIVRNGLVPSTDLTGTQSIVDMGAVTLPLADIPPGSLSPYFALTVTSTITADRFLDVVLIDTKGTFILLNIGSSSVFNNLWIDQPDATRDLGRILGSNADRDQAVSAIQYAERFAGGPLAVYPDASNRMFAYSAQGAPALTAFYPPQWWTERLA
jgi:hypothetical protein